MKLFHIGISQEMEGYPVAMSVIWLLMTVVSIFYAVLNNCTKVLGTCVLEGAASAVELALSLAGSLCLWSGLLRVMEAAGLTAKLSRFLRPVLSRLFPNAARDPEALGHISANVSANLLGLGNAATPAGIAAAKRMQTLSGGKTASHELCRFLVLNTASVQLLPTTVAALRAAAGCETPFDILPAVWVTSVCALAAGLLAARLFQRMGGSK